jgi:hypothetical protein
MSVEQRVMLGMFGELPPPDVHGEMVSALKEMTLAAAKAVYDERYVGPTEEQLEAVADAAAHKLGTSNRSLWKIDYGGELGVVKETPFKVVKIHQRFIKKAQDEHKTLKRQVSVMAKEVEALRAELNEQHSYTTFVDDEQSTVQQNFKAIVATLTALELKYDRRIAALEHKVDELYAKYYATIARLANRTGEKVVQPVTSMFGPVRKHADQ